MLHHDVREELKDLFIHTRLTLKEERKLEKESVFLIGELARRNAAVNLGLSDRMFFEKLGITKDQFYKRAQAARVMGRFPEFKELFEQNQVAISVLAMIAPKITEANHRAILGNTPGKTKREMACFLSRVNRDGVIRDQEGVVEFNATITESRAKLLDRAREVLASRGKVPNNGDLLEALCEVFLEKKDPVRKAERAVARDQKKKEKLQEVCPKAEQEMPLPAPGQANRIKARPQVPAAIQHRVRLRDGNQCTFRHPDGSRCEERMMLEFDHIVLWCRGGRHTVENLRLLCRRHNQGSADRLLGIQWMERHRVKG